MTNQTQVSAELSEEQAEAMDKAGADYVERHSLTYGSSQAEHNAAMRAVWAASPGPAMAALITEMQADMAGKTVMSEEAFRELHGKAERLSVLEEGLEGLRALSERATAGPLALSPEGHEPPCIMGPDDMDADDEGRAMYRAGQVVCLGSDESREVENLEFIVAAVNLVRALLTKEQTRG